MHVRKWSPKDYRTMPWKNGGGSTTQLAIFPPEASLDRFLWRLSSAHVVAAGPFSHFSGVDRSLAILSGDGLILDGKDSDVPIRIRLDPSSQPYRFPGEMAIHAELCGGPVCDLNLMTRRDACGQSMHRLTAGEHHVDAGEASQVLVYCAAGSAMLDSAEGAQAGDLMLLENERGRHGIRFELKIDQASVLYLVRIVPRDAR